MGPEALLACLVVLAAVTLIGHLIWLGVAWFVRAVFNPEGTRADAAQTRCPFCEHRTRRMVARCDWCGRDLLSPVALELADVAACRRTVERLKRTGHLTAEEADDLLGRLQQYRRRLLRPPQPKPAVAAPPGASLATAVPERRPEREDTPKKPVATRPTMGPLPPPALPATPAEAAAQPTPTPKPAPVSMVETPAAPAFRLPPPREAEPPAEPKPPRKSFKQAVSAFLEERNIRWAELVLLAAGLLIVGPSIALVISLWETLEQIPVFKFAIFVGVSSAVFGIGLYAYHRWKLESTGWALLVMAVLLVPLNLWAMAGLSKEQWNYVHVAWEMASLGIFAFLVGQAAKVLIPRGRWFLVTAVVGNAAMVLLVARLAGVDSHGWAFTAAAALPVAVFVGSTGGFLSRASSRADLDGASATGLFTLLGTAAFALAVPFGLLIARGAGGEGFGLTTAVDCSSAPVALAAGAVLAAALAVVRGTSHDASLAAYRTAGTTIALVAVAVMLAALGMAWPQPAAIMAVGALNAAALVFVAFRHRLLIAHAGAIASAAVVYLTGYYVLRGHLPLLPSDDAGPMMLRLAISAETGAALVGLVAALGGVGGLLAQRGLRKHGEQYAGGAVVAAFASLSIATARGFMSHGTEAWLTTALYGVYGAGSLALCGWFRRQLLATIGLVLLVLATLWGLWCWERIPQPYWATVLAAEALLMGVTAAVLNRFSAPGPGTAWNATRAASGRGSVTEAYRVPLLRTAEILMPAAVVAAAALAWLHRFAIDMDPAPVVTAGLAAAFYFLLAWGYRSPARTWVGSLIVLGGLIHTLVWNYRDGLQQPWLDALLTHATGAVLATVLLDVWTKRRRSPPAADALRRALIEPLGQSALVSSCLAVAALALVSWDHTLSLAGCLFWLAAVWLVTAWTQRWPAMVTAAQAVLTAAVLFATTAWLEHHPWSGSRAVELLDPRSLQVYGIGLGILTGLWVVARIALRGSEQARRLLDPEWPAVDRLVGHGVVVLHLLASAVCLMPGLAQELFRTAPGPSLSRFRVEAFGPTAWLLLAVLGVGLVTALWHRWREAELTSGLLAAATVPVLVAGWFASDWAVASAARWGLAVALVVLSVAVWERRRLLGWCRRLGASIQMSAAGPRVARAVLIATTAAPILGLTILAALAQIGGVAGRGGSPRGFFGQMAPELSYLVPLALVTAGLVGFAVRERSAGYAFSAGLVAKLGVGLGYLLSVVLRRGTIGAHETVTVVQLLTITAAAWAGVWLAARRWVDVWREEPAAGPSRGLMTVQLGFGVVGNGLLLVPALAGLILNPRAPLEGTVAAGSWIGWIALVSVAAAVVARGIQLRRTISPGVAGLIGMAALGLLACTVRGMPQLAPEWGYRTLMLGWAMYAVFVVAATWWAASQRTLPDAQGPPQAIVRAAASWVSIAGVAAVLLGLKAAFFHNRDDLPWAAGAVGLASVAGAAMAVWRRREGWAFASALGVNLAASLGVWYTQHQLAFEQWRVLLVQANVIASAAVALVWLAARKRLYELRDLSIHTSPLLATQTALGAIGSAALLSLPVAGLLITPSILPGWAAQVSEPVGWVAFWMAAAACAWYVRQVSPQDLFQVAGGVGLGLGVLVACSFERSYDRVGQAGWVAYHTLTSFWAALGSGMLVLGMVGRKLRFSARIDGDDPREPSARRALIDARVVQGWMAAIGAATVALALLHCADDPGRPWWSAGAILAVAATAGLAAVWLRLSPYVWTSGLLVNVAGTVIWAAWEPRTVAGLVYVNALCLAVSSCFWSLVGVARRRGAVSGEVGAFGGSFTHFAAQASLVLLGAFAAVSLSRGLLAWGDPDSYGLGLPGRLGWLALGVSFAAATISLWDRSARFPLKAWYAAGLIGLAMTLDARGLPPLTLAWTAGHELAAAALVAAALARWASLTGPVWKALGIPVEVHRGRTGWFSLAQAAVAAVAFGLSVWISIDSRFDALSRPGLAWIAGLAAGPLAAGLLVAAGVLTAGQSTGRWRSVWQIGTLALAAAALTELGWAWLADDIAAPWLHRNVILLAALVTTALVAGFGLPWVCPAGSGWTTSGKRITPALGGLALAVLGGVLVQEVMLFERPGGTPMAAAAIAVVAAALVGLLAGCLGMALSRRLDPFGLSDRGRTAYVYLAEALAVLVAVHVRLTMPWLFGSGFMRRYWMLIV
ncbi:MAG: hypothetical protein ACYTG0_03285, partial [Planctomycetota bacterium]